MCYFFFTPTTNFKPWASGWWLVVLEWWMVSTFWMTTSYVINKLKTLILVLFICQSFHWSKNHHTTYSSKPHCASKPYYLILIDVWVLQKSVHLLEKNSLSLIGDHTRLCWVYLMNAKYEVEICSKIFIIWLKTSFK